MNTALNIRDLGADLKEALAARARAEGVPMSDLARSILAKGLGLKRETPVERWKRENAEGLAALEARAEETLSHARAYARVSGPQFGGEEA